MRVLYLCQNFSMPISTVGSTRHYEVIKRLIAAGCQVSVLTTDTRLDERGRAEAHREFGAKLRIQAVRTHYRNEMSYTQRKLEFLRLALAMTTRALLPKADVVFASSTPLTIAVPALARRYLRRTPFVFEVRDLWPEAPFGVGALVPSSVQGRLARGLAAVTYRAADRIVALSPDMRSGILESYAVTAAKVVVATNAGNPRSAVLDPTRGSSELQDWHAGSPLRFIYGGRLGRANDVAWLVDVFGRSVIDHGCDARLLIVGDGADRPRVQDRVAAQPGEVQARIRIVERIPKNHFLDLLASSSLSFNLFADVPALRASSPNKVFESWAMGVPVASNQGGWMGDELARSGSGIDLSRDVDRAAASLGSLDPVSLSRMARSAADTSAQRFTWDMTASEVHRALRSSARCN